MEFRAALRAQLLFLLQIWPTMGKGLAGPVFGGRFCGSGRHERMTGHALVHDQVDILACGLPHERNTRPDKGAHATYDGD